MASIAESALTAGHQIGRYFSIVSMLPSLGVVLWIFLLLRGGAWGDEFEASRAVEAVPELGLAQVAALIAVAMMLGIVVNPFQFAITQLFEGYWGFATRLSAWRINSYRRKLRRWAKQAGLAHDALVKAVPAARATTDTGKQWEAVLQAMLSENGDSLMHLFLATQNLKRLEARFPPDPERILPTRLGNMLRATEDRAGKQYGLSALLIAGHLSLISDNQRSAYVRDTRQNMDLAVRLCLLSLMVTPLTALLLANDGGWVFLALAPYLVAYLAYRGAISAAQGYGSAVRHQIDLDRFGLYEALHLPNPANTIVERNRNHQLIELLRGEPVYVAYARKDPES